MMDPNAIMENVGRNSSRSYVVSVIKYGNRVFNIEESHYYEDKEKALEAAKKIKPPVNCFVEIREKIDESFSDDKSVIWRSDRTIREGGSTKGDFGLKTNTTANGPEEKETPKEIKHEAGDTSKLKKEKTPNPGDKLPETKTEEAKGKKDNKGGKDAPLVKAKLPLKPEKAPNESKVKDDKKKNKKDCTKCEGKVPKDPATDEEGTLIKDLTEEEEKE